MSVTDTPGAGPFWAEICTVKDAAWPALTLDPEAWTLTHNCACDEGDALGDEAGAADSGSHAELAAVAGACASADGIPSPRAPQEIKQAAITRRSGDRIRAFLSGHCSRNSPASGGGAFQAVQPFFPASVRILARSGPDRHIPGIPARRLSYTNSWHSGKSTLPR